MIFLGSKKRRLSNNQTILFPQFWSFYELKRNAAPGLDGESWQEYKQKLEERLPELERELHRGSYRATPAKREYITKDDGRQRPLGIQAVEDKLV